MKVIPKIPILSFLIFLPVVLFSFDWLFGDGDDPENTTIHVETLWISQY